MSAVVSPVRSPKPRRSPRQAQRAHARRDAARPTREASLLDAIEAQKEIDAAAARVRVRELPLQLLALGLMADGAGSDPGMASTRYVQDLLRAGLHDADAILRHSLNTPNTTIEELLVQRVTASPQYAAVAGALPTDSALSSLVCDTAREGLFAGIALAYRFFIDGGRR